MLFIRCFFLLFDVENKLFVCVLMKDGLFICLILYFKFVELYFVYFVILIVYEISNLCIVNFMCIKKDIFNSLDIMCIGILIDVLNIENLFDYMFDGKF